MYSTKQMSEKERSVARRSLLAGAMLVSIAVLTACNTVEGVGEDVEAAGDAVADTARDAKN